MNANTGPVFLTYRAKKQIDDVIEKLTDRKPEYDFTSEDGIQHTLFVISDPDEVSLIIDNFKEISTLYIADGHHRSAAAVRVMEKMKKADKNTLLKRNTITFYPLYSLIIKCTLWITTAL